MNGFKNSDIQEHVYFAHPRNLRETIPFLLSFPKSPIIACCHLEYKSNIGHLLAQYRQNIEISSLSSGWQATAGPTLAQQCQNLPAM